MHAGTSVRSPRATIEVTVLIAGAPQVLHKRPADGACFASGTPGQPYALRVRNLTGAPAEVITSVDGRNTLKDEPADKHASGGFIIPAFGFYDFTGFRLNDGEVREFVFGTPGRTDRTVAFQATGSAASIGVLGFAAYRERQPSWTYTSNFAAAGPPVAVAAAGSPETFCSATTDSAPLARSIGTEMGALREDRVRRVSFTRESGEPDILAIGYDTEDALRSLGIIGPPEPDPFPGTGTGYERYTPAEGTR